MSAKLEVRQELEKAINQKEVTQVQGLLSNNLLWFSSEYTYMQECYQLAKEYTFIFTEYDKKELNSNKNEWTQEYYYEVLNDLVSNFSKERYEFLMELAFYLSGEKDSGITTNNNVERFTGPSVKMANSEGVKSKVRIASEKKSNVNHNWLILLGGIGILLMVALIVKKMMS